MLILALAELYVAIGLLFAVAFLTVGIVHVDAVSKGAGIGFRLIILPGVIALWPVMLRQWIRRKGHSA